MDRLKNRKDALKHENSIIKAFFAYVIPVKNTKMIECKIISKQL